MSWVPYANLKPCDLRRAAALNAFSSGRQTTDEPGLVMATCKTGFAAARSRMVVHAVVKMAGIQYQAKMRYAAQWLCGGGSTDIVAVADPEAHGGTCDRCMDLLARGVKPGVGAYVYRCSDINDRLLYVGSTANEVGGRLADHKKFAAWWPEVQDVRVERFDHELAARGAEFRAIRTEHPIHNVHGKRRDGAA